MYTPGLQGEEGEVNITLRNRNSYKTKTMRTVAAKRLTTLTEMCDNRFQTYQQKKKMKQQSRFNIMSAYRK